ncbi:MAG: discoidin domain-containing protein, partial [Candidatus Bathyarchaeia archaeon]
YVGGYAFYNFSDGQWQHHWTQYNFTSSAGAGVMFTTLDNVKLYFFDKIAGSNTGILNVTTIKRLMSPNSVYDRCGHSGDNTATRSIDGDVSTYWRHNAQCYHWIIYDLGSSMNVSRIRIYQPSGSTYDWGGTAGIEVYVSNNPSNWGSAVWSGPVAGDGWVYTGVFQAQGRYVRLVSKSNSADQRLYEVQVEVQQFQNIIEVSPIKLRSTSFKYPLDITWFGAVVAIQSGTDFIHKNGVGLWVVVEHPPKVEVIANAKLT